jgi:excinuclease ABC subunit C
VLDRKLPADTTAVVSIAKPHDKRQEKYEKIYLPGRKNPLALRPDNPVLLLMMRIRDEAHRRAISYHRKLRGKKLKVSELDRIPGIGEKRRNRLLKHFGDIRAVAVADRNALLEVPGITESLADKIVQFFRDRKE